MGIPRFHLVLLSLIQLSKNRENLNVTKRINSKPAFNIQDLIDGNFKEGLSYINKSLETTEMSQKTKMK